MSFIVATVIKWDFSSGYAEDGYGVVHRFYCEDVSPEDRESLHTWSQIIIPDIGYIELSTSAFCHWLEQREAGGTEITEIFETNSNQYTEEDTLIRAITAEGEEETQS